MLIKQGVGTEGRVMNFRRAYRAESPGELTDSSFGILQVVDHESTTQSVNISLSPM